MTQIDILKRALGAVLSAGSPLHATRSGDTLEAAQDFAEHGRLEDVGHLLAMHDALHPRDMRRLHRGIPALVRERFWIKHLAIAPEHVRRWCESRPDWAQALGEAVRHPTRLAAVARAMAEDIQRKPGEAPPRQ